MGTDTDCVTSGVVRICGVSFPENEVHVGAFPPKRFRHDQGRSDGVIGPKTERRNSECRRPLRAVGGSEAMLPTHTDSLVVGTAVFPGVIVLQVDGTALVELQSDAG